MGNDGEGWYIGQSMGRGYEGCDVGRARVQGARISGGSECGKAEEAEQRKDRWKHEAWKRVLCTEGGQHRIECGRKRAGR